MVPWIFMKMHILLHICKHVNFQLNWQPMIVITLCIGLNYSRAIPFYRCGWMDKCKLCFSHNNMRALCDMLMRSWAILGFYKIIFYSKHNIGGKACNYKFNRLFFGVWHMIECGHHLMHLHLNYNDCPSWGLGIDGVWILLATKFNNLI